MPPKKIKKTNAEKNKVPVHASKYAETDYPIFCFKHLEIKPKKDYKFYTDFLLRLKMISNASWELIEKSNRHGIGTETMDVSKIKVKLPPFVTPDVKHLSVFRANGDNRPFLGIRNKNLFHVIFLEEKFGDIYDHGKK